MLRWGTTLMKVRAADGAAAGAGSAAAGSAGGGEKPAENAVELARFFRQAIVWGMLTLGSALVLAGAVVTLIADIRGGG
jgi:hypothetical protein